MLCNMILGEEITNSIRNRPGNPEANLDAMTKMVAKVIFDLDVFMADLHLKSNLNEIILKWAEESPAFDRELKHRMFNNIQIIPSKEHFVRSNQS